ncbi:hypothetical protein PR048_013322 [Dryococelus australis]|uniref:Integrase zinc-binding domain-containing protein n=1 Tax=Dryococelus australis TaxID=614101 RepID=A0ABQ9HS97_9NEOP|nr:hypothetical protein PR048_013322 [Dryococelus australis]
MLMKYFHDSVVGGLKGFMKTHVQIEREFFWSHMRRNISKYVAGCFECQFAEQPQNSKVGMHIDAFSKFMIMDQAYIASPYYLCPNLVEWVNKSVKVAFSIFHILDHHSSDESISELNLAYN